jgi:transcriptional antiterminator
MDANNITVEEFENLSQEEQKKLYDAIPEEEKEVLKQKTEMLTKALPYALMAKAKTIGMQEAYALGSISQEYCEKFKCSMAEFLTGMLTLTKVFMEQSIEQTGISFNEKVYQVPDRLKKKNRENYKAIEKENKKSMGNQMADALKRAGIAK